MRIDVIDLLGREVRVGQGIAHRANAGFAAGSGEVI